MKEDWISWEHYLIWLGERSVDYAYTKEMLEDNIEYFRDCFTARMSPYYALEFYEMLGKK